MKVLYVTPRFPYPPLKGDKVIPYYRLRTLGKRHEITLLSFYETEDELAGVEKLRPYCNAIYTVRLPKWKSVMNVATKGLVTKLPFQVVYYQYSTFKKELGILLERQRIDLIHGYMLRIAPYLSGIPGKKILDLIDSMQLNLERRLNTEMFPKRFVISEELRRIRRYERGIGSEFNRMIIVSEKDKDYIPSSNISVIPLGIDTDYFVPQGGKRTKHKIIFSGNMGYAPNIHAVKWFVERCLRRIQEKVPEASLVIAGANPSQEVINLARRKGVVVTGFVEAMPSVLNEAQIAIAPMQSGSGMQFKILEAMSCGLPVITTTLGLGSIKAKNGKEIILANSEEEFVNKILTIFGSPESYYELGMRSRKFIIQNHSWDHIAAKVEEIYSQVLEI